MNVKNMVSKRDDVYGVVGFPAGCGVSIALAGIRTMTCLLTIMARLEFHKFVLNVGEACA